jgi:DNA-binding NarL/FixJ family response regulator
MKRKILTVDDHLLFAEGIRSIVEENALNQVIGQVASVKEALRFCKQEKPDLILMDYFLTDGNGFDASEQLLKIHPELHIILLTMAKDFFMIEQARLKGIKGYLLKNIGRQELISAIDTVFNGGTCFQKWTKIIPAPSEALESKLAMLSKRERHVAVLVCRGLKTSDIASELNISELTVSTHRKNILKKLDLKNSIQLSQYASMITIE